MVRERRSAGRAAREANTHDAPSVVEERAKGRSESPLRTPLESSMRSELRRTALRRITARLFAVALAGALIFDRLPTAHGWWGESVSSRHGVDLWRGRLSAPEPHARRGAAWALGRFAAAAEATPVLTQQLVTESDPSVQLAIVGALVELGAFDTLRRVLAGALLSPRSDERGGDLALPRAAPETYAAILTAAGPMLDELMVRALLQRLRDVQTASPGAPHAGLSRALVAAPEAAFRALAAAPDAAFRGGVNAVASMGPDVARASVVLLAVARRGDPAEVIRLRDPLRTERSEAVVRGALEGVASLRLGELLAPEVLALARNELRAERGPAIRVAGQLGWRFSPAEVRAALRVSNVRAAMLDACVSAGNADAEGPIAELLRAPWAGDRRAAAEALATLGGTVAVGALVTGLREERDAGVRAVLFHALARVGGSTAERAISEAAARGEPEAMDGALECWLRRGAGPAPGAPGARAALDRGSPAALRWGARAGDGPTWGAIERALRGGDRTKRGDAGAALVLAGGAGVRWPAGVDEALADASMRERDDEVRRVLSCAEAAAAPWSEPARGVLRDVVLSTRVRDRDEALVRASSALALAGDGLAEEPLRALLASPSPSGRAHAAYGLSRLLGPRAAPLLGRAFETEFDAATRSVLALAYARTAGPAAVPALDRAARFAWTQGLADAIDRARGVARGSAVDEERGDAVLLLRGVPAFSLREFVTRDGAPRVVVAASDGGVFAAGLGSGALILRAPSDEGAGTVVRTGQRP